MLALWYPVHLTMELQLMNSGYPSGLTASAVEAVIRFYWSPQAELHLGRADPAVIEIFDAGLIEHDTGKEQRLCITERGVEFVRHILDTPLPVQMWHVVRADSASGDGK